MGIALRALHLRQRRRHFNERYTLAQRFTTLYPEPTTKLGLVLARDDVHLCCCTMGCNDRPSNQAFPVAHRSADYCLRQLLHTPFACECCAEVNGQRGGNAVDSSDAARRQVDKSAVSDAVAWAQLCEQGEGDKIAAVEALRDGERQCAAHQRAQAKFPERRRVTLGVITTFSPLAVFVVFKEKKVVVF